MVPPVNCGAVMNWPGARIVTFEPKLEKGAKVSSIAVAPTVIAPETQAGEISEAFWALSPAARMTGKPSLMTLETWGRIRGHARCEYY